MLMFNITVNEAKEWLNLFKYISCYCSTWTITDINIIMQDLNTSYVNVQLQIVVLPHYAIHHLNTSHVTVQLLELENLK